MQIAALESQKWAGKNFTITKAYRHQMIGVLKVLELLGLYTFNCKFWKNLLLLLLSGLLTDSGKRKDHT